MSLENWLWIKLGFRKRAIQKFIEDPDKCLVVNPRFCDHVFVNGVCELCHIKKEIIDNYYFTWDDAFKIKKENEVINYSKKLRMYYVKPFNDR